MTFCESEFVKAFGIAKRALSLIGDFRTPPTPDIYGLWYRYAEGLDENLCARMNYQLEEVKSLTKTQLLSIIEDTTRKDPQSDWTVAACKSLEQEALQLQSATTAQIAASQELGQVVATAANSLTHSAPVDVLQTCLSHIVASHTELNQKLAEAEAQLVQTLSKVGALTEQLSKVQQDLTSDSLTGVGNRSHFEELIEQSFSAKDIPSYVFLLLVDLDNFKQINDTFGHQCGDTVLRHVAAGLQRVAGKDAVARIGGDEFAIVIHGTKSSFGQEIAAEAVRSVGKLTIQFENVIHEGRISVSIGASSLRRDDNRDSWFNRADKLLYHAKGAGRNCAKCERAVATNGSSLC